VANDMSMLTALAKKWNYSVENPGAGRLVYREGNREYTFPLYEENGALVLVGVPSSQRICFFFTWHWHPPEFSAAARERILPRIAGHLQAAAARVRIFERNDQDFQFYPELLEQCGRASELLEEAGFGWLRDYSSIDVLHEEYGVEICGVKTEARAMRMAAALQRGFPHWHHQNICRHEPGRDSGWAAALSMFPARPCNSEWLDED
jgi:hypothetical protein